MTDLKNISANRVSLHILHADRCGELYGLLVSLWKQSYTEWDLVLIDESTGMPPNPQGNPVIHAHYIQALLRQFRLEGHGVVYFYNQNGGNIGKARNLAVEKDEFKNEIIIRIDDDSLIEPDFVEKLVKAYEEKVKEGIKVGGIGCIVPQIGFPPIYNKVRNGLMEEIKFSPDGNFSMTDNGGMFQYHDGVYPTHHMRSSFLFTRTAWEEARGFNPGSGGIGWREETEFCMRLAWKGYKFFTDTSAIAWHLRAPFGGGRKIPEPQATQLRNSIEISFRKWAKRKFDEGGDPYGMRT